MLHLSILAVVVFAFLGLVACESAEPPAETPTIRIDCPAEGDELVYLQDLFTGLRYINKLFTALLNLSDSVAKHPSTYANKQVTDAFGKLLVRMATEAAFLRALEPPNSIAHLQLNPVVLADSIDQMAIRLAQGIDNLDQNKLDQASAKMIDVDTGLQQSWAVAEDYCNLLAAQ